ncbi:MAG: C45 family autoproteolytic acyltransferase/hydrolase, partial [Planctomycetaceae bacterium]
ETIDGYSVLHLKGTPYEMGYQQGALLRERVQSNMHNLLVKKAGERIKMGLVQVNPRAVIESILQVQKPYVPAKYFEEMEGLAAGAGIKVEDVVAANFIPELFHCSGFAIMNGATRDGTLYHGRVLDYAIDWGLQDHAVIAVVEPEGGVPFVNVTYAGFIGSVTGMNARHVSIGEMGGSGLGHWAGVPMAF